MPLIGYPGSGYATKPARKPAYNPLGGVLSDPGYVAATLAQQKGNQLANAALRQQRSQALINYGDPSLAGSLGFAVDPNTAAASSANQYSTVAQLLRAHQRAQAGITAGLAGRHILHSGALGQQLGNEAHAYGQSRYDAQQQLLQQLNAYLQNYLGSTQASQDAVTQALLQAYPNYQNALLGGYA